MWEAWKRDDGTLTLDPRAHELATLALQGEAAAEIINKAALAGGRFLFYGAGAADAALDLVTRAIGALDRQAAAPDLHLLRLGAECAERRGKVDAQDQFLARGLAFEINLKVGRPDGIGHVGVLWAQVLARTGRPDEGLAILDAAAEAFITLQQAENVAHVRALQERMRASTRDSASG